MRIDSFKKITTSPTDKGREKCYISLLVLFIFIFSRTCALMGNKHKGENEVNG